MVREDEPTNGNYRFEQCKAIDDQNEASVASVVEYSREVHLLAILLRNHHRDQNDCVGTLKVPHDGHQAHVDYADEARNHIEYPNSMRRSRDLNCQLVKFRFCAEHRVFLTGHRFLLVCTSGLQCHWIGPCSPQLGHK